MMSIRVNVNLYGTISRLAGGKHVAQTSVELPEGATKADLLARLKVPPDERGYLFINAVLCDVPGLDTGSAEELHDGDHVGIFSIDRIWPYQYRDGVNMSPGLKKALEKHGAMHHTYDLSEE